MKGSILFGVQKIAGVKKALSSGLECGSRMTSLTSGAAVSLIEPVYAIATMQSSLDWPWCSGKRM